MNETEPRSILVVEHDEDRRGLIVDWLQGAISLASIS
jgi:hypothetical protein